jgi:hypothetical protein
MKPTGTWSLAGARHIWSCQLWSSGLCRGHGFSLECLITWWRLALKSETEPWATLALSLLQVVEGSGGRLLLPVLQPLPPTDNCHSPHGTWDPRPLTQGSTVMEYWREWPESWLFGHPKMNKLWRMPWTMPLTLHIGTQGELAPSYTLWVGEGWVRGCTCSHCELA